MYRFQKDHQFSLTDFNQPIGMKLNPENRWIKKAETIPWGDIEIKYATLFPSKTGMPAKPLRMALGSLLLQKHLGCSDRELVEEIRENSEAMIDSLCYEYGFYKPRTYRQNARRDYLNLAKCKKRTAKKIRKAIKRQLQYIRRDREIIGYLMEDNGCVLTEKQAERLNVIDRVYGQQKYMYDNKVHSVDDRIYRNRKNLSFCKQHGIRLSGPMPGRPKMNAGTDKSAEYADNRDCIAVERAFALAKSRYGLDLITAKLDSTTRSSIALSIIAMNVDRIAATILYRLFMYLFSRFKQREITLKIYKLSVAEI